MKKTRNKGFTLIELLVTIALMSVFSVFALRLFANGWVLYNDYRARSEVYFEETIKQSKAKKNLQKYSIRCDADGFWSFNHIKSDSLMSLFPYKTSTCVNKAGGWVVIYTESFSALGRM